MTRAFAACVLVACVLAGCATAAGKPQPLVARVAVMPGAPPDELTVTVGGLRSDAGSVRCFLYDNADGWPSSEAHIVGRAVALPAARVGVCRFSGVARDRDYAIIMLHDENNDGVLQKNMLGIPTEGYGFSNDPHTRFSAPSFDACRFHFASGAAALAITAQY
jgi:uncharacterized protein (DUF2141 family)